jgi:hypothetical protein
VAAGLGAAAISVAGQAAAMGLPLSNFLLLNNNLKMPNWGKHY